MIAIVQVCSKGTHLKGLGRSVCRGMPGHSAIVIAAGRQGALAICVTREIR